MPNSSPSTPGDPARGSSSASLNHPGAARPVSASNGGTHKLPGPGGFYRRPPGAIFGDSYLFDSLLFSDEHQHRYGVHQMDVPEDLQVRICPNPDCGAVFPPRAAAQEKFCTDCGKALERGGRDLVLIEANQPIPEAIVRAAAKGLSHGSVRAPLAAFVERLAGLPRHCVVVSRILPFEATPEPLQAVQWAIRLARGLDYLHDNGVTFDGLVDASLIGMVNGRPVWANFTSAQHHPQGYVTERLPDTRSLALLVFSWLTGKARFERDPNLTPALSSVFEGLLERGIPANALEWADALEQAVEEIASPKTVDLQIGRCSNVGKVRSLNEDSLLCLEVDRIQQSHSHPLGFFAVADGMGGHSAGEIASGTIINVLAQLALKELFLNHLTQSGVQDGQLWLQHAIDAANHEVYTLRKSAGSDMGSTLVAAVVAGNRVSVAHVGDSRAYRISSDAVQRLTVDHSLVERLIATNQITREEARYHPQRNVIYRTIGDKANIEVETALYNLSIGDYLLLCSDGLVGPLTDEHIAELVRSASSPQAACEALIQAANANGGDDNISAIVVRVIQPC
ncbi:MAG: Stp1/IreP family PP2C-type Ser/Thr phosphatase [Chloroflexota bacterium]